MKIITVIPIFCVMMTSFSLPSERNPPAAATRRFQRMRRSTSDLYAMSLYTQQTLQETATAYCRLVHSYIIPRAIMSGDGRRTCRNIDNYVPSLIITPELTRFPNSEPITQTILASVLLVARRLNHTLTRMAAVGTEALLRPRKGGVMAACVSRNDGHNPCLIDCSASKTPEIQLYCELRARVLPRLRNLMQLLEMQIPDSSKEMPRDTNIDVTARSSHSALRLYTLAILGYSEKQMSLISERFRHL